MGSIEVSSSFDKLREQLGTSVSHHEADLWGINKKIHDNPETSFEEFKAHDNICDLLEKLGYTVTRHAYGLETSFEAEYGNGGALITYNAEYDALPGIGHACGHNLIATSSIAAFLATAEAIRENGIEGRVRILGTPAEEHGGGKIDLVEAGAYKDVDACLMGHPGPADISNQGSVHGFASARTTARKSTTVTFKGKNAHAGAEPWMGKNALDAVISAYLNISLLRQQLPPSQRVHGVIVNGGERPNIIPDLATLELYARAERAADVDVLCDRLANCFEGAAKATDCEVDYKWVSPYKDLRNNSTMDQTFIKYMEMDGRHFLESTGVVSGGSTDQGNVTYEVPGSHWIFNLDADGSYSPPPHHPDFAKAAGTQSAFLRTLEFAKGMAATGYSILTDSDLREKMWQEFRLEVKGKGK